jgi:glyoxylase-like metal-dependent hydrolase (beta-lactamase superfamily II)
MPGGPMEPLHVPQDEVIALDHITSDVSGLRTYIVNLFGIRSRTGWVLVDAGLRGQDEAIMRWAREHIGDTPPSAIVLTHAHFDHIGSLEALLQHWDVPVWVHRDELPFVTGALSYPPPDPTVGGGLMARLAALYPRDPIDLGARVRTLPDDGQVPELVEWQWIATPGHSPGHVSFFRERDRALIVGDAFCTTKQESFLAVATQRPELHGPPAYFTIDWDAARDSVRRLAALNPGIVAPSHGRPMSGPETTDALRHLADRFDELSRPEHGKYVTPSAREPRA